MHCGNPNSPPNHMMLENVNKATMDGKQKLTQRKNASKYKIVCVSFNSKLRATRIRCLKESSICALFNNCIPNKADCNIFVRRSVYVIIILRCLPI